MIETSTDFIRRPQSRVAVQRLLQWIHVRELEAGDRLPAQEELRVALGFHNKTLNTAMNILTAYGAVVRKRKVGTIVVDPEVSIPNLWRVGITSLPAVGEVAFFGQLQHLLQTHLQAAGANPSIFMHSVPPPAGEISFQSFPGLGEALKGGHLDGLLDLKGIGGEDWKAWRGKGLALVHAGPWDDAPAGTMIDHRQMVERAVARLCAQGCRRLAVVSMNGPKPGFSGFWKGFVDATDSAGIADDAARSLFGGEGPHGGQRVGEQLLALPPGERPDGLVVIDDRIGSGLAATLVAGDPAYRPAMAVLTNRQAPMGFALPVLHFEVDVDELARRAGQILMAQLLNPQQPLQREWIHPRERSGTARHLVASAAGASCG